MKQNNRTKICMVTSSFLRYEGDFSGRRLYDLVNALTPRHEIQVVYIKYPTTNICTENIPRLFNSHPIRYSYKKYPLSEVSTLESINLIPLFINMLIKIKKVVTNYNIDLIHAHWTIPSGFLASLVCSDIPLITTIRGLDVKLQTRQRMLQPFVKHTLKKSTRIIALSNQLKQEATEIGIAANKICVIPGGVDVQKFKPIDKCAARSRLHLPQGFLILFVGNLIKIKRVDMLLRVSARLSRNFHFHVLVIGDGPERTNLENLARDLGLENIVFTGLVSHDTMPLYMAASDVLVLPSESEGLPGCIQEAMACGIPSVATNIGGVADLITDNRNGYLVNNELEMEVSLKSLMSSPDLVGRMGRNAVEFARNSLSLATMAKKTEELYASVLEENVTAKMTGGKIRCHRP